MSKESPIINFDPTDPKYREVTDLPREKRDEYVTLPKNEGGGFVKVRAKSREQHYDAKKYDSEGRRNADQVEAINIDIIRDELIGDLDELISKKKAGEMADHQQVFRILDKYIKFSISGNGEPLVDKIKCLFIDDIEVIKRIIQLDYRAAFEMASDKVKSDPNIIREFVAVYPKIVQEISDEIWEGLTKDPEFISSLVKINSKVFEYLPELLRDDERIILETIKTWPEALKLASVIFIKNPEFLVKAVMANPLCLEFAPNEFKEEVNKNRKLIEELIDIEPKILLLVDKKYLSDKELVLRAVKLNGEIIKHIDEKLITEDLILEAVETFPLAVGYWPDRLGYSRDFFEKAVQKNGLTIEQAMLIIQETSYDDLPRSFKIKRWFTNFSNYPLKTDSDSYEEGEEGYERKILFKFFQSMFPKEIFFEAVKQNGMAIRFFHINALDEEKYIINTFYLHQIMTSDDLRRLFIEAVGQNGFALQYAPVGMKKDRDICMRAIIQNPEAIKFVDESIRGELEEFISRMHTDQSIDSDGEKMAA